jgi:hypothetical protein
MLRPSPYGAADHVAAAALLACAGAALALAALAETARYAAGAGLLAGWWAWHGPRLTLGAITGGRR